MTKDKDEQAISEQRLWFFGAFLPLYIYMTFSTMS